MVCFPGQDMLLQRVDIGLNERLVADLTIETFVLDSFVECGLELFQYCKTTAFIQRPKSRGGIPPCYGEQEDNLIRLRSVTGRFPLNRPSLARHSEGRTQPVAHWRP